MKPYYKGDFASEIMLMALRMDLNAQQMIFEFELFLQLLKDAEKWRARKDETTPSSP
jgi:hypothetical protein